MGAWPRPCKCGYDAMECQCPKETAATMSSKVPQTVLEARKQLLVGLGMIDKEAIRTPNDSMIIPYYTLENMTGEEWDKLFCEIDDMDLPGSERNEGATITPKESNEKKVTPLMQLLNYISNMAQGLDVDELYALLMERGKELLPSERSFASAMWEGGKCRAYNSTDYPDFDTFFNQYNQAEQK